MSLFRGDSQLNIPDFEFDDDNAKMEKTDKFLKKQASKILKDIEENDEELN